MLNRIYNLFRGHLPTNPLPEIRSHAVSMISRLLSRIVNNTESRHWFTLLQVGPITKVSGTGRLINSGLLTGHLLVSYLWKFAPSPTSFQQDLIIMIKLAPVWAMNVSFFLGPEVERCF